MISIQDIIFLQILLSPGCRGCQAVGRAVEDCAGVFHVDPREEASSKLLQGSINNLKKIYIF